MSERLVITPEADGQRLALADGSATLRLVPRLGLVLPRYHFHVGRVVHAAQELGLFRVQTTLLLGNDLTGQAELCDFQVSPALDETAQAEAWRRLVGAAIEHASPTAPQLVAELPGWRDAAGQSPFWQALGARFYRGDPQQAQQQFGDAWRSHLAALLPRQTIYLSFLGTAAETRLSQPADSVSALAQALAEAGFDVSDHVRIDDGGPVLSRRLPRR
ncbi:arginine N-succinyltransferase [Roseateles asaccharophilus]|uniref:Arginine N-succinyltransferase n=1 Tax=Roseateles asaccharophilus TaxID=582607 RepID=A0ABU2AEU8_9BURK|nr:arginine N-succinyltransferase [Roseateles asaccharophilus]MDR7334518.1 arginine N-succinyltransferase [Roseateles asaccharophilus]